MLTDEELQAMRDEAETVLTDTCTIQDKSYAADGGGGNTVTWSDAATSVKCRLAPLTKGMPAVRGDRIDYKTDWIIHVPYDQAISAEQRVVLNSDNFEVMSVEDDHHFRVLRTAYCRRTE
jgi:hypothetical protein